MDTQHFFPDFKPNQVLTSTQLNQLRQYLVDQTRLSRVRLTGTGIICGLYGNTNTGETIKITGGYGITTDGYIIEIPDTIYPKFRNYFDPDTVDPENDDDDPYPEYEPWRTIAIPWQQIPILELMSEEVLNDPDFVEQEDNPTQDLSAEILDGKVLVLYLEMFDDPLKSCIVTDCNNKGENVVLTVRALLIDKAFLDEVQPCGEKDELIHFPKLNAWLQTKGKNLSDVENSGELNKAYQNLALKAVDQINDKVTKAYNKYKSILNLEPQFTEMVAGLSDTLDNVTGGSFNQYHFDFVRNLARSFNEFADTICPLVKTCMADGASPRHLMLRDFIHDEAGMGDSGKYRHYFMPSPARNVLHEDLEKAQKQFARILHLAYNSDFGSADAIKITPGKTPAHPPGENAIPHYYKLGAVEKWWQPDGCCELHPPLSYHKNKMAQSPDSIMPLDTQAHPLHLDPGRFNFYNIEGIMGKQLGDAIQKLEKIKKDFNLEFDLLGLSFDQFEGGGVYQGLEPMIELLKEIETLRQTLEIAIIDGVEENQELIMELLEEIAAKETAVLELNTTWIEQRRAISANCNISHLQADYLQLRSELICTYQSILQSLDKIPEIPPPQAGDGCVDFDELEPETMFDGDDFPPGSEIFSESNIPVTLHEYFWTNGGIGYNWAMVQPATADFGEGNIMWTNNVNLGFDFTNLETAPNKVSFLYKNDGGSENIQVNGGEREIVRIRNAEGEIAPGVFLEVNVISEDAGIFMAILTGPVQDLKVGGQEFSIDQVCATADEASVPSYPLKIVNLKRQSLERSVFKLVIKRNNAKSPEEKGKYSIRIERLNKEKSNLENISKISGSVNRLINDVMVNSHISGMKRRTGGNGLSPMAAAGANPTQDLAYGFFMAVLDLRSRISLLLDILPKDVRGFNYLLYSNTVKEILEQIVRVRMFVNYLLDVLVAGSGTIAPLMRFLAGPLLSSMTKNLAQLMDFMNAYFKIRYNCFPAQLATIYFHLEHLMNLHLANFGKFAHKHPGMEHIAGVPKGGTFILVGEKAQINQLVRADFALNGMAECCCEIDPEDICLPPIARIDNRLAEAEIDPQTGALLPIDITIDIMGNDLNLNKPGTAFELSLKSEVSRMGASLSIIDDDDGRKLIRYVLQEPQLGIDEFAYEITENTERCQLSDNGKVILMVRQKSNVPMYAGGDLAVTHQNTPVIVDVALNDVLNPQMLDSGYSLTANATTPNGNIVEVITIEDRRAALHFIPIEGFTGRDQFAYTINFANTRASGIVTALVIPCCDGQGQGQGSAPAMISGSVFERTVEGLEGALSGGTASLMQSGNTLKNTVINKGQYTFRNVSSGTYDIQLARVNAATGEPTHETKVLNNIVANEGQTTTLELVFLDEIPRGNSPGFSFPRDLNQLEPLIANLENNAGFKKAEAQKVVLDTLPPRMAARTDIVNEIKNGGLVADGELLEKTGDLVSGKLLSEGGSTMRTYKQTMTKLISNHASSRGAEKTAYRALIDSTVTSMLDEIAVSDISHLSQGKQKHVTDVIAQLKEAGISTNSIRKMWKSGTLKDDLKISAVTKMNKFLT